MNPLDETPDIPPCPHCGHDGNGLNWAYPDAFRNVIGRFERVQCACLKCGAHGPAKTSYQEAVKAFASGQVESEAA